MAKVGRLHVDFEARTARFEEGTTRATRKLRSFGNEAKGTRGQLGGLRMGMGRMVPVLATMLSLSTGLSSSFANLRIKENLDAQLRVAEGSANLGNLALSKLQGTARKMPSTLAEVTQGYIRLKNMGLDPSERSMLSFGNTAAAQSKSLMQFIEAVADANTMEFERLKEFGILARQTEDSVRFTFKGVTTTVKRNSEEIQNYLRSLGETHFAGSLAAQMDTVDGKLSNLSDAWFNFTNQVAETGDAGGLFKGFTGGLTEALNAATDELRSGKLIQKASVSVDLLGIEDIEAIKTALDGTALNSSNKNTVAMRANLVARLKQLEAELLITEETAKQEQLQQKRAEGAEALAEWEERERRKELGVLKTYGSDYKALSNQIYTLQAKIREGSAGNTASAIRELEALKTQQIELSKSYEKAREEQRKTAEALVRYTSEWDDLRFSIKQTFAEGVAGGEKFSDILGDVAQQWKRALVFNTLLGKKSTETGERSGGLLGGLFKGIGGLFGGDGGSGGGLLGGIGKFFGGLFGDGGHLGAGKWGIAGERGPEIIHGPANVTPMGAGSGGSVNVSQTFNINGGGDPRAIAEAARQATLETWAEIRRRPGWA